MELPYFAVGQLTDTNNLNFTLLIFYTNFYIFSSLRF